MGKITPDEKIKPEVILKIVFVSRQRHFEFSRVIYCTEKVFENSCRVSDT